RISIACATTSPTIHSSGTSTKRIPLVLVHDWAAAHAAPSAAFGRAGRRKAGPYTEVRRGRPPSMTSDLTPELLLKAYSVGLFPMAESADDPALFWVDPERRGIMPLDGFHVPRSLRKTVRKGGFAVTCNTDFVGVVRACAEPTATRPSTWINDEIVRLYAALHG